MHSVSKELTYRQSGPSMVSGKPRRFTDSGPKHATGVIPTRDMGHLASPYSLVQGPTVANSNTPQSGRWQLSQNYSVVVVTVVHTCSTYVEVRVWQGCLSAHILV